MKMTGWVETVLSVACLAVCAATHASPEAVKDTAKPPTPVLEQQARPILNGDEVERRRSVDRVFDLARRYAEEGRLEDAARLYREALQVEAGNLPVQLELARVLKGSGETAEARERAKQVYDLAEDGALIDDSVALLDDLGAPPVVAAEGPAEVANIEMVLVPLGKPHPVILEALRAELQKRTGIRYVVADQSLPLGAPARTLADAYVTRAFDTVKADMSSQQMDALLAELGIQAYQLSDAQQRERFVAAALARTTPPGLPTADQFQTFIAQAKHQPQYDTQYLWYTLRKTYPLQPGAHVKGYLAVTDADIYGRGTNFLFAANQPRYAVMSYQRFLAANTSQHQNRARLIERLVKQGLSSSLSVLGMPRCSNVRCVTNFPMSVVELDEKSAEPCAEHAQRLDQYKVVMKADTEAPTKRMQAAKAFEQSGRRAEAMAELEKAIALEPNFFTARYTLAAMQMSMGRNEEAAAGFARTTDIEPYLVEAWRGRGRGVALAQLGRFDESITALTYATQLRPADGNLYSDLGYTYYIGKQNSKAIEALQRAVTLQPRNGLAHYNLALVRHAMGDDKAALQALEQAEVLGYRGAPAFRQELEGQQKL